MAEREKVTLGPGDVGRLSTDILLGLNRTGPATHKGEAVEVIRATNAGDGEGFDPKQSQLLLRKKDGTKAMVPAAEVTFPT